MKILKYIILLIGISFCGQAMAQEGLFSFAKKMKTMRDSMVVKGVDRRYFVNAFGQFNNIRYHHNSTSGYLNDWFVNTSIGIRL